MNKYVTCTYEKDKEYPSLRVEYKFMVSAKAAAEDPTNPKYERVATHRIQFKDDALQAITVWSKGEQQLFALDMAFLHAIDYKNTEEIGFPSKDAQAIMVEFAVSHMLRVIASRSSTNNMVPNTEDLEVFQFVEELKRALGI